MSKNRILLFLMLVLALLGGAISVLALFEHVAIAGGVNVLSPLCNFSAGFSCQAVMGSRYSTFLGISLGSYGFAFYVSLFLLMMLAYENRLFPFERAESVFLSLATLAVIFSIFLFGISKFVIKALCPICLASYAVNVLLWVCAWRLNLHQPFLSRWSRGIGNILAVIPLVGGVGRFRSNPAVTLARTGVAVGILIGVSGTLLLPDFLINQFLVPRMQRDEVVKSYANAPVVELPGVTPAGQSQDYRLGPIDAPIQIVEFSDFECPACRVAYEILEQTMQDFEGVVSLVYKNFPLDKRCNPLIDREFHHHACFAAQFARCAGEQGKFWQVARTLFTLPELEGGQDEQEVYQAILRMNEVLGLDGVAIDECMQSGRHLDKIKQDVLEGQRLGVAGTPAFWVNGRQFKLTGEDSFSTLFTYLRNRSRR